MVNSVAYMTFTQNLPMDNSVQKCHTNSRIIHKKGLGVAGIKPARIITDGLKQYCHAIKKVIRWNWRIQKKNHIISSGVGKNAFIERLKREIKRRIKWFSTFHSLKGAKAFFRLWFYHFNQRKSRHVTWLYPVIEKFIYYSSLYNCYGNNNTDKRESSWQVKINEDL